MPINLMTLNLVDVYLVIMDATLVQILLIVQHAVFLIIEYYQELNVCVMLATMN